MLGRRCDAWWVLLGALPLACAGAEIENSNPFTGGVQTATETAGTADDSAGDDDDDDTGNATNDDGDPDADDDADADADADGDGTQGDDGDTGGPDAGPDDNGCVPGDEICDGVDNDCDDDIDEEDPQLGVACETGLPGVCAAGAYACQGGFLACEATSGGVAETCNGQDDDCDGTADQGNPGGGGACDTGQPGVCGPGTDTCQSGGIVCVQNSQAGGESCNGQDDDCNGAVDDGNPGGGGACNTGQLGVCAAGTQVCQGGGLACSQNQGASGEACGDGQDNDCDGTIDNGCGCSHDVCTIGAALVDGCDGCVASICASDTFCCTMSWDALCVNESNTICGQPICQGSCGHSMCVTGGVLVSGCDPGGCVANICGQDPFCCNTSWDGQCVGEVASFCSLTC